MNVKVHNQEYKTHWSAAGICLHCLVSTPAADTYKIESVQHRAAWCACCYYLQTSNVSKMLENLHWPPLDQRHIYNRLHMTLLHFQLLSLNSFTFWHTSRSPPLQTTINIAFSLELSYTHCNAFQTCTVSQYHGTV